MKVLLATHNVVTGDGQGRVNYELARYLAGNGHQVTLLADRVDPELAATPGIHWHYLKAEVSLPNLVRGILWSEQATRWLNRNLERFDIIHLNGASAFVPHHVNTCHFVHGSFREYLRHERSPGLRGRYHQLYSDVNYYYEKKVFGLARQVVAVSEKTAKELGQLADVRIDRLDVIYNGVDTDLFRPSAVRRKQMRPDLGIAPETFALLYAGEFVVPRKGLGTLLQAMHGLTEATHLYVAGKGNVQAYRQLLVGIEDRVHFLGYRSDVADLFTAVDCFVYPTRYDACCLVVLEALASGIAVVTTVQSGSGELIHSGQDGVVLTDPYDVEALRHWLRRLAEEKDLAQDMGQRARRLALGCSWTLMAQRYEELYGRILVANKLTA